MTRQVAVKTAANTSPPPPPATEALTGFGRWGRFFVSKNRVFMPHTGAALGRQKEAYGKRKRAAAYAAIGEEAGGH
jgi:hypothetical protein